MWCHFFFHLHADHEPQATHLTYLRGAKSAQAFHEIRPHFRRVLRQVLLLHDINDRERGGARQGIAAKGRAVRPLLDGLHALTNGKGSHGYTASHGLGHGQDVRLYIVVFTGKKFAGAPIARLHLVDDQQHPALTAQLLHTLKILRTARPHPAFSLDNFQQERSCVVSKRLFKRIELIVRDMPEARRQRTDMLSVTRVPGCRQGSKRTAMIATRGRDNVSFPGAHAGKFNSAFNGLSPGVAEEEAIQPRRSNRSELFEQRGAAIIIEQFWTGDQRFRLLCHRLSDHGMRVPKARHAHTGGTINVLLTLVIPQARALTTNDGHKPFGVYNTGVVLLELLEGCHGHSFTGLPSPALAARAEWGVRDVHPPK